MICNSIQNFEFMHTNQLRLWYEWKKDANNTAYSNLFCYEIVGELNVEALCFSINFLSKCYPILCTSFNDSSDCMKSSIIENANPEICQLDFSNDLYDISTRAYKTLDNFLHKPFNLSAPPLYRSIIIKIANNKYLFGLGWHHIIEDAISIKIMLTKLMELYENYISKKVDPYVLLPSEKHGIRKYDCDDIAYWKKKLDNITNYYINLTQQKHVKQIRPTSKRIYRNISLEDTLRILKFAGDQSVTLFTLLTAVMAATIYRFTNQDEFMLWYSISVREKNNLDVVGFYANNLPLTIKVTAEQTYYDLLLNIHEQRKSDFIHKNTPHHEIIKLLRNDNKQKIQNIFNVLINQFTNLSFPLALNNTDICQIPIVYNDAKNDLTFFYAHDKELKLEIEYRNDIYVDEYIDQFLDCFINYLLYAIKDPYCCHNKVSILSQKYYNEIVYKWNSNDIKFNSLGNTIVEQFEGMARLLPLRDAIHFNGKKINYTELNEKSNKIANYILSNNNETNNKVIAILAERSIDLLIAILGVWKARYIYLPLDPEFPLSRLEYILDDAKPNAILYSNKINGIDSLCNKIKINPFLKKIENIITDGRYAIDNIDDKPLTTDPIYLIYTSGSTGKPKGVINKHEGFFNRIIWMIQEYSVDSSDTFLLKTPIIFDISLWEMFVPLAAGAKLCIALPNGHKDPHYLKQEISNNSITIVHFVPSMLKIFLSSINIPWLHNLRIVITSGEALPYNLTEEFHNMFEETKLINLYGPTEASIEVTVWDCSSKKYPGIVPIGKALPNVKLYILDNYLQPVPVGISGELYIGGIAVSNGYLNKKEMTLNNFISNPYVKDTTLYKTGDIVRWLSNGNIEYLGRVDNQIKLHGYRIELNEIENHINNYPGIRQCVVLLNKNGDNHQLIAFIEIFSNISSNFDIDNLRNHLTTILPIYMIPHRFELIDSFPTNVNGKLDRNQLLHLLPSNQAEKTNVYNISSQDQKLMAWLRDLWATILNIPVEMISHTSDFFRLGGDSLSALQLLAQIEKNTGVRIPVITILDHSTIEKLGNFLVINSTNLNSVYSSDIYTVMPIQISDISNQQIYYLDSIKDNNIVLPFQWLGDLVVSYFDEAVKKIIGRHKILRSNYTKIDNKWHLISNKNINNNIVSYNDITEFTDSVKEKHISEIHMNFLLTSRNPETDHLIEFQIFKINSIEYVILLYVNHCIVDRASVEIFFNEILNVYKSLMLSQKVCFPEPGNYNDYIRDESLFLSSNLYNKQLEFWVKLLKNKNRKLLSNNTNYNFADNTASYFSIKLAEEALVNNIEKHLHDYNKTMFVYLLTVLKLSLIEYFNINEFTIAFTISKRTRANYINTVGPVSNTALIYVKNQAEMNFKSHLDQTERDVILAYDNCDIPIAHVAESLNKLENNKSNSLYSVSFDYESQPWTNIELPNIKIEHKNMIHSKTMKRLLTIRVSKLSYGYELGIRYRTALFSVHQIKLFSNIFINHIKSHKHNSLMVEPTENA